MGAGALAGGAANALMFFSLLVGLILLSLLVFSYASYSFLVTFVNTAAGNDEVIWPGDPIQDWFFKLWYFVWLIALWAVPASLLLGLLHLPGLRSAILIGALLWLVFPISLLSSMSASSQFVVIRPLILSRLFWNLGRVIVFYLLTAIVSAGSFSLFYLAVTRTPLLLLVAAIVCGIGFLVYARLLGRIALLMSLEEPKKRRKSESARPAEADNVLTFDPWSAPAKESEARTAAPSSRQSLREKKKPRARQPRQAYDPWAPPPEEKMRPKVRQNPRKDLAPEDPYGPAEGTYDLAAGEPHAVASPADEFSRLDIESTPYEVSPAEVGEARKIPAPEPPEVCKREEELAAPRRLPPPPAWPLFSGVYTFAFYPTTLGPLGTLSLGFFLIGGVLRLLFSFFPS